MERASSFTVSLSFSFFVDLYANIAQKRQPDAKPLIKYLQKSR